MWDGGLNPPGHPSESAKLPTGQLPPVGCSRATASSMGVARPRQEGAVPAKFGSAVH